MRKCEGEVKKSQTYRLADTEHADPSGTAALDSRISTESHEKSLHANA